jgi:fructose transport system ATP-binding protein
MWRTAPVRDDPLYSLVWFWLRETGAGRHVYAVGNNPEATRLVGIPPERVLLGVYVLAGVFYGIASLMSVARTGVGDPNAGQTENLDAITAVVLGGTSLFGGRGIILGSLVGAVIVGVLRNGLTLMSVSSVYQVLITGVLVIRRGRGRPAHAQGRTLTCPHRQTMNTSAPLVMQAKGLVKRYGRSPRSTAPTSNCAPARSSPSSATTAPASRRSSRRSRAPRCPMKGRCCSTAARSASRARSMRAASGIETVYQDLAVAPAMTIAENLFLGRELRRPGFLGNVLRMLDKKKMLEESIARMNDLKVGIRSMLQAVETLSGGQRQCVAVARSGGLCRHVVILDEPTAALGVKEGNMVLELIRRVRDKGLPVVLISHNMPHVFEVADRIHVARLGKRAAVLNPKQHQHERHGGGHDRRHDGEPVAARSARLTMEAARAMPTRCGREAPTRSACASSTSAWCCRRCACTAACPRPTSPG